MQLEAFRRQKAGKTQASAASVLSDPVSRPLPFTDAQRSNAEPARLPAGSGNSLPGPPDPRRKLSYGDGPSHVAATLSACAGNLETPVPAEQHQQHSSEGLAALAAPKHGARAGQRSALQDDQPTGPSSSSVLQEAAKAGQGASQSLRSAGLSAPPPLPLPPAAFNSRYCTSCSMSFSVQSSTPHNDVKRHKLAISNPVEIRSACCAAYVHMLKCPSMTGIHVRSHVTECADVAGHHG